MQNFAQQVQMQLSPKEKSSSACQKQTTFSEFFIAFLKRPWNLEHFETKDEYPSLIISQIFDSERGGYLNV